MAPAALFVIIALVCSDFDRVLGLSGERAPVEILLEIQGGTDSTVTRGGIHSGKSGNNAMFSPWSGIVEDYGTLVVIRAPQDTARPPVPALPNLPADTTLTVELPGVPRSEELFYRNIVGIIFDDAASGSTVRGVFARYNGTIIGGVPGDKEYFVQIPDPGPTFAALDSIVTRINAEVGVKLARHVYRRWSVIRDGRYRTDRRPRVPLTAPDTVPAWVYAAANLASDTGASYDYYADVILVSFKATATQAQRQAAIDSIHGLVIGGQPMPPGEGFYYVRLEAGRRLQPLIMAVTKLWHLPQVGSASLVTRLEEQFRRPKEQGDFALCDPRPDSAAGQNAALAGASRTPDPTAATSESPS